MTLNEQRLKWEEGLTPLLRRDEDGTRVLVILVDKATRGQDPRRYHCHRYFQIGNGWECSVDGQAVPLEAIWSWLNDPSAWSTHHIKLAEPAKEE